MTTRKPLTEIPLPEAKARLEELVNNPTKACPLVTHGERRQVAALIWQALLERAAIQQETGVDFE